MDRQGRKDRLCNIDREAEQKTADKRRNKRNGTHVEKAVNKCGQNDGRRRTQRFIFGIQHRAEQEFLRDSRQNGKHDHGVQCIVDIAAKLRQGSAVNGIDRVGIQTVGNAEVAQKQFNGGHGTDHRHDRKDQKHRFFQTEQPQLQPEDIIFTLCLAEEDCRQDKCQQLQNRKRQICIASSRQPLGIYIGGEDQKGKGKQRQQRQQKSFSLHERLVLLFP